MATKRASSTGRTRAAKSRTSLAGTILANEKVTTRKAPVGIQIEQRVSAVAAALGSKAKMATLLAVSPSQPTRWIEGSEKPNSENARTIVDLDHVIARAELLWKPSVISSWLIGSNAFLDGARPIDVLKTRGSSPVIDALDQELAGGYA